jgi:hypothetical protein
LIDDVYRDYIEKQRAKAAGLAAPALMPDVYWGLLVGGYYDPLLDIGADAGGTASAR